MASLMHLTLQVMDLMLQTIDLGLFACAFFPFPFSCFKLLLGGPV
ncbi:MAG TPA: hypothetical protein VIP57_03945 [Candidatus Dormibacteraeota bacterium]